MRAQVFVAVVLASALAGCATTKNDSTGIPTIDPAEASKLLDKDTSVVFLDVRSTKEFTSETGHLHGALLIPVDSLETRLPELEQQKSRTIITYCRSGVRSARAQKILSGHGFRSLSMAGGILRWNSEHLPVVKEQP